MPSKRSSLLFLVVAACGGSGSSAKDVEEPTDRGPSKAAHHSEDEEPDDGLELETTRGREDPADIEAGLAPHQDAIQDCFLSRIGKQKWLGGKIVVKWVLNGDGTQVSAQVAESEVGSWPVEKCVLDLARSATFAPPHGNKETDFSLDWTFDSGRSASWWDEDKAAAVLAKKIPDLAACATTAKTADPTDVSVTLYLGTRGKVQSVGFASPALIDDAWASCAEKTVMGWVLSDPKGSVVKLGFVYRQGETPSADSGDAEEY